MTRTRPLTAVLLTGLLLAVGIAGTATAEAEPSPSSTPSSTPSPAAESLAATNQPPVAAPDQVNVESGASVALQVLANDTDDGLGRPEGEAPRLDVVAVTNATADRFTFTAEDVTFTAQAGDVGTFEADYAVTDGELSATAHLTVQVAPAPERSVTIRMTDDPVTLKTTAISGKVLPLTGGAATVRVQRRTADGWVGYAETATDVDGVYTVDFRTSRPGERTLRAVALWPDGARATSGAITRRVRAVADPVVSGPLTRAQVPYSWRSGCPVSPAGLRKIHINRFDYTKRVARGAIVVRAGQVGDVVELLTSALDARFPIRLLKPTDHYYDGGRRTPTESDKAAMRAGNTSAFNCRPVTGNPYRVSQHSYGNAVDINTIENPYVTGSTVYPAGSREYLDRSRYRRGMILPGSTVADTMRGLGWLWGARWSHADYQHFSSNGG